MMPKERVEIRPIEMLDAEVLMDLNNCAEVSQFVVGSPKVVTMEQQRLWMEKIKDEKNTLRFMICIDGSAIGTIIISALDNFNLTGNLNIKLLPNFQGKGLGTIAIEKACDYAFDNLGLYCLTANVLSFNEKSIGLFKKCGFHQDGVLRSRVIKDGKRYDLIAFSLLKSDR